MEDDWGKSAPLLSSQAQRVRMLKVRCKIMKTLARSSDNTVFFFFQILFCFVNQQISLAYVRTHANPTLVARVHTHTLLRRNSP